MLSGKPFYFHWRLLWAFPPGIHRFVTSFLLTGPGLSVLFDTYFVFTYLSQLEKNNSKFTRKEDLIWYLMFVGTIIIVGPTKSPALCTRDPMQVPSYSIPVYYYTHLLICPDSGISSTAIAVPGIEEDYPCTSAGPSFAYLKEGQSAVWARWDCFNG